MPSPPTPQGQPYITLDELKSLGLSAQFLNSPLLTQQGVFSAWQASQGYQPQSLVTPLAWGAVAHVGTGPATGAVMTGTPYAPAPVTVQVLIALGGAVGTATFQVSFDGGTTFSPAIPTAASVPIVGTGVTLTFAAGTYVSGDTYTSTYTNNGSFFQSLNPGVTGATQPLWPSQPGQTVLDGTVTWVSRGPNTVSNVAILSASEICDVYLRSKVGLSFPLATWGYDLKQVCAWIAGYNIANVRGYNPAIPAEDIFRIRFQDAMKILKDFANGIATLDIQNQAMNPPGAADPPLQPTTVSPSTTGGSPPLWAPGTRGSWAR